MGEAFLDTICGDSSNSFCDDPCINSACTPAAENGAIDAECATTTTVGDVDACAESVDLVVCQMGGGCMFDALEAVCP